MISNAHKENVEMLTDLIDINNDRIAGYSKATEMLDGDQDADLLVIFDDYRQQSQQFKSQLIPMVAREADDPDGVPSTGKMSRNWIGIPDTHQYNRRETILISCAKGEEECEKVFRLALENMESMDQQTVDMIESQAQLHALAYKKIQLLLELERE